MYNCTQCFHHDWQPEQQHMCLQVPLWPCVIALLDAESSVSSEITSLLSLNSIVLRFPQSAAQWFSLDFFFLGPFWSPKAGVAAIPEVEQSPWVDFFVFFFCIALCICFCKSLHFKISFCYSVLQIKNLCRWYPRICAVSSALILNKFVPKNRGL